MTHYGKGQFHQAHWDKVKANEERRKMEIQAVNYGSVILTLILFAIIGHHATS